MFSAQSVCKKQIFLGLLLVALALVIYLPRVASSPQPGDGPELAAAAVNGAIVHPPGYPLYSMLARGLVSIFPANPYLTLACFSAVLQSLAVLMLFLSLSLVCSSVVAPILISLVWLTYGPAVRTATDVEVFALHHLLVFSLSFFVLKSWRSVSCSGWRLFGIGMLCGVALSNHHTSILWIPLVYTWLISRQGGFVANHLKILTGFILGLCCYLYLLIPRAPKETVAFVAPENLKELYLWFVRDGYGTFSLWSGDGSATVSYFYDFLFSGLASHWLVWVALVLAIVSLVKSPSYLKTGIFLTACLHLLFVTQIIFPPDDALFQDTASRFYSVVLASLFLVTALMFDELTRASKILSNGLLLLLIAGWSQTVMSSLATGDASSDKLLQQEIDYIAKELPENAVFISSTDRISMGLQYMQIAERRRTDIELLVRGLLPSSAYRQSLVGKSDLFAKYEDKDLLDFDSLVEELYLQERKIYSLSTQKLTSGFVMYPVGLSWEWTKEARDKKSLLVKILQFCSSWGPELETLSGGRDRSILNRQLSFGRPVEFVRSQMAESDLSRLLLEVVEYLNSNRALTAAGACEQVLNGIS